MSDQNPGLHSATQFAEHAQRFLGERSPEFMRSIHAGNVPAGYKRTPVIFGGDLMAETVLIAEAKRRSEDMLHYFDDKLRALADHYEGACRGNIAPCNWDPLKPGEMPWLSAPLCYLLGPSNRVDGKNLWGYRIEWEIWR